MKPLFLYLTLLGAFGPSRAWALYCRSAADIEATLELCDDNERFAQAAEACRNDYLKAVKAEQGVLGGVLKKGVAAGGSAQQATEGVSAAAYDKTLSDLDALIARGLATELEERGYIAHFLPPFHWPASQLGPMPARDDPELWKAYDGEFCFGEHRETIDHMTGDIEKAVADLKAARKEAAELKTVSVSRGTNLSNTAGKAAAGTGGKSAPAVKGGAPNSGASDITGVRQDKAKQAAPQPGP